MAILTDVLGKHKWFIGYICFVVLIVALDVSDGEYIVASLLLGVAAICIFTVVMAERARHQEAQRRVARMNETTRTIHQLLMPLHTLPGGTDENLSGSVGVTTPSSGLNIGYAAADNIAGNYSAQNIALPHDAIVTKKLSDGVLYPNGGDPEKASNAAPPETKLKAKAIPSRVGAGPLRRNFPD